jgi:hypothetical protein
MQVAYMLNSNVHSFIVIKKYLAYKDIEHTEEFTQGQWCFEFPNPKTNTNYSELGIYNKLKAWDKYKVKPSVTQNMINLNKIYPQDPDFIKAVLDYQKLLSAGAFPLAHTKIQYKIIEIPDSSLFKLKSSSSGQYIIEYPKSIKHT